MVSVSRFKHERSAKFNLADDAVNYRLVRERMILALNTPDMLYKDLINVP